MERTEQNEKGGPTITSKYHSRKTVINGHIVDSRREARRYQELLLLQKCGEISNLTRQVRFQLLPSQKGSDGKTIERPVSYVADFVYMHNGKKVVEDVKGFRTPDYILKRKMMLFFHGIRILET